MVKFCEVTLHACGVGKGGGLQTSGHVAWQVCIRAASFFAHRIPPGRTHCGRLRHPTHPDLPPRPYPVRHGCASRSPLPVQARRPPYREPPFPPFPHHQEYGGDQLRQLVHALCPSIYGHELVKAGLVLALLGGVRKHAAGTGGRRSVRVCIKGM